jgi:hypothetical protein
MTRFPVVEDSENDVSGTGGDVQEFFPRLSRNELGNATLPMAMDTKAKQIAQPVITGSDSTEDIVGGGVESRSIASDKRLYGRHDVSS